MPELKSRLASLPVAFYLINYIVLQRFQHLHACVWLQIKLRAAS